MLFVRAVCHALAVLCWFYAIMRIPLAEVNALLNLGPVYATLGAALYFGEKLRLRRITAIMVSFLGALVIIRPGFAEFNLGTLAVLVTAPLFAVSDLIAKALKSRLDDNVIIITLSGGIALASLIPALVVWQPMSVMNWVGVFAIGLCATLGHVTLMKSFPGADVGRARRANMSSFFSSCFSALPCLMKFRSSHPPRCCCRPCGRVLYRLSRRPGRSVACPHNHLPDDHHRNLQLANLDMSCGFNEADIEFLSRVRC